jgi:hypothetical protein
MGIHVSRGVEVKNYCRSRGSLPFSPPANLLEGGGKGGARDGGGGGRLTQEKEAP